MSPELTSALTVLAWLVAGVLILYAVVWVVVLVIVIPIFREARREHDDAVEFFMGKKKR